EAMEQRAEALTGALVREERVGDTVVRHYASGVTCRFPALGTPESDALHASIAVVLVPYVRERLAREEQAPEAAEAA
ncbi:MAG: hypothetical protein Q7K26_05025, partial [bacterium]|nr:hypothetical protein [bacterium]